jgi:hypothetical protein
MRRANETKKHIAVASREFLSELAMFPCSHSMPSNVLAALAKRLARSEQGPSDYRAWGFYLRRI